MFIYAFDQYQDIRELQIKNLINKTDFTIEEISYLLQLKNEEEKNLLFTKAKQLEKRFFHSPVNSYGVIEISTYCSQNCDYCQLRKDNTELKRKRMNREQIIEIAKEINKAGIKSIVIRSGYDDFFNEDRISYIIYSIKEHAEVDIILSFGERTFEEYKGWKIAGATGYQLRFKSSNPSIYKSLNRFGSFESRVEHIKQLKSLGYKICSGSLVGLPNQTFDDIAADIQFCKELNLDIIEFLPFCPHNNTPLQFFNHWSEEKIKHTMAVARLVLREKNRCVKPKYLFNLENYRLN